MPRCSTAYAPCSSRSPRTTDGGPQLIVPAVWDQPRVPISWASPLHSPEDWRTYARAMRREVLNAHLLGIRPQLVDRGDRDHPGCHFQALLAMVYWHLLHISRPWRRPALCRGLVSGVLCPDTAHAAVLSRGGACACQPMRGPRTAAGWVAAHAGGSPGAGRPRWESESEPAGGVTRPAKRVKTGGRVPVCSAAPLGMPWGVAEGTGALCRTRPTPGTCAQAMPWTVVVSLWMCTVLQALALSSAARGRREDGFLCFVQVATVISLSMVACFACREPPACRRLNTHRLRSIKTHKSTNKRSCQGEPSIRPASHQHCAPKADFL